MFTGIVTELGVVISATASDAGRLLVVAGPDTVRGLGVGDSVAVNGVCLTATSVNGEAFSLDVVGETLSRTNLGGIGVGDRANLERPMPADGRFDGHVVQGHVDGVGRIAELATEGGAQRIRVTIPDGLSRYLVEKGSVTVDGVSLTVTAVSTPEEPSGWFEVVLIPHTLDVTVLGDRRIGDEVNLEMDVIAKYVERLLEARA